MEPRGIPAGDGPAHEADRVMHLSLPPGAEAPGAARRAVLERLGPWGQDDSAFRVGLLVSELVTHAVQRGARAPITLAVEQHPDALVLCVDDDAEPVSPGRPPDPRDALRRGLLLVAALSDSWGVDRTGTGTRVWCRLAVETARRVPEARKG